MTPSGPSPSPSVLLAVTDARAAAAEILADLRSGALLSVAFDRHAASLDGRDRRWLQELVYGMLRRRAWLDLLLEERIHGGLAKLDDDLVDLLRTGAQQLLHMDSVPNYAAIAQTVELAKTRHGLGASRLTNAVLRRLDRERGFPGPAMPTDPTSVLAAEQSHPKWLVDRWVARWGTEQTRLLLEVNNREAPLVLRPHGIVREQLEAILEASGLQVEDAPLVQDSFQLLNAPALGTLAAFREGLMFVQDPAATLVSKYAHFPAGATVADLCAAPGGKTVELSKTAGIVIAADSSSHRLIRLSETMARLELRNVLPMIADARRPAVTPLAAVLVDAPCTGTGTFRRHPDARWRLTVATLATMVKTQRAMLRGAAAIVAPGGLLVYSTCSLEPEENDAQIDAFLDKHAEFTLEAPPAGSVPAETLDDGRLRVLPQLHGVDGAFAARLRRKVA